ncbi:anthranilate synthase component I [Desulfurobacterium indicum]|uniref:Anthranilate synthase component I n=1 Tax=Desulfurobacterium indicum TaxID=1914305 RepID=A0A1R1ML25_9BACT|nr:anthranilate synthase component I family protein [Desulfurobacterium indicum]OMH40511.1 anthranilate synthase component I [Desulfurobacterium indicum]
MEKLTFWVEPNILFLSLKRQGYPVKLFLDSAMVDDKKGHFSFICIGEQEKFVVKNLVDDAFSSLKEFYDKLKELYADTHFGIFGYFSYDAARYIEKLPEYAVDDIGMPDISFFLPKTTIVFDNLKKEISVFGEKFNFGTVPFLGAFCDFDLEFLSFNMTKEQFFSAVTKIKDFIASGDSFQVNFSQRLNFIMRGSPVAFYHKLRSVNPSPFAFYLDMDGFKAVSCSPERLVRKSGLTIETRPIAGTRRRGKDETEDQFLSRELFLSEKERAEHIMLVDLERNDMGKIGKYGTVIVDELMVREVYSHVMHIVSNIKAEVRKDVHPIEIVKALFPGGTITGAPKVRTMEIIEELEPTRRALYTGSVGYFSFSGDLDFNIVIRTLLLKESRAFLQVGAGIVWDSDPEKEYRETIHKARAFLSTAGIEDIFK